MNKRQWKKKYKKEHGYNPPSKYQTVYGLKNWAKYIKRFYDVTMRLINDWKTAVKNMQEMPEDEFKEWIKLLTEEAQDIAWKYRKRKQYETD